MKALYKSAPGEGNVSLVERPMPTLDPINNVMIKVDACSVCGMDFHIYHGKFPCTPPFIMGHEFVGIVSEIGDNVTAFKVGDRVISQPHLYACGTCDACKIGLTQFCKDNKSVGINRDGAMTSYVAIPEKYIHKVPVNIPNKLACILEPFSMVVGNFGIPIKNEKATTAVVIGAGQIGMFGVVAAKGNGVKNLILSGVTNDVDVRFPTAKKLGADIVVDSTKEDIVAKVMDVSHGVGADIILEASGSETAINAAIKMIKPGGLIVVMGGTRRDQISVNWDTCLQKAIRVVFHMKSNYQHMSNAIEILANPYTDFSPLITKEASLDDWQEVFDFIGEGTSLKSILYIPHE